MTRVKFIENLNVILLGTVCQKVLTIQQLTIKMGKDLLDRQYKVKKVRNKFDLTNDAFYIWEKNSSKR